MNRPETAVSRYSNVTVNTLASSASARKRSEHLEDIFEIDGSFHDVTLINDAVEWQPVCVQIPGQQSVTDSYSINILENVIGLRLRKIKTMIRNNESRYTFFLFHIFKITHFQKLHIFQNDAITQ